MLTPTDSWPLPGQVDPAVTPCAFCRRRLVVNGKQVFQSCSCKAFGPPVTVGALVAGLRRRPGWRGCYTRSEREAVGGSMKLLRRLRDWLRPVVPYLNVLLVVGCYWENNQEEAFCQPVPWVWWVLAATVGAFLVWPLLKRIPWLAYPLIFLQGAFFLVCLYCAWFSGFNLIVSLFGFFLIYPLLLWTPVLLGVQVLRRAGKSALPRARWVFVAGMLPLLLAQGWALWQYQQVAAAVATLPPAERDEAGPLLRVVPRNYIAERLAGRLFKYHERPEFIYDGWRPPLHDPLLNVCVWLHGSEGLLLVRSTMLDPIGYAINSQATFYHQLFPSEPVKAACACADDYYGKWYLHWVPGKTIGQEAEVYTNGVRQADVAF